jgi:hypothetical protein
MVYNNNNKKKKDRIGITIACLNVRGINGKNKLKYIRYYFITRINNTS